MTDSCSNLKGLKTANKAHRIYKYNKMCADVALYHYNNKNDTNFELVEDDTLESYSIGCMSHCFFKAKEAKEDSWINAFFAKIMPVGHEGPVVTCCKILTQDEISDVLENGYSEETVFNPSERELFEVTEPICRPELPTYRIDWKKNLRRKNEMIASRALDHYNKTNGTNFVLSNEDPLSSCNFSQTWIHICFKAVDSPVEQCNAEDSPTKLFFAEIKYSRVSMPAVTNCQIVDGETKVGCENCTFWDVIHPVEGYRGEFLDNMETVEDTETCNKVYEEEYLGFVE